MKPFVKCCVDGCRHAGTMEFRIKIPPVGHPTSGPCLDVYLGLAACKDHKASVKAEDFMSDDAMARINDAVAGMGGVPPDFDRAFLEWMVLH